MTATLDIVQLNAQLAPTRFAGHLHHLASTDSTSLRALAAAQAGARAGVWIADEQTAGRGRGGHTWHSPPGDGLYMSALVVPDLSPARVLHLSLAAGLAAQSAIARVGGDAVDLRWPNDLVLQDRKCGGILVESVTRPVPHGSDLVSLRYAIIGIGINVGHTQFPPELQDEATSLRRETGNAIARQPLLTELLLALDRELTALEGQRYPASAATATGLEPRPLLERFAASSSWVSGKRVVVDGRYTGTTSGLTAEGFLQVSGDDGELRIVRSGGVRSVAA